MMNIRTISNTIDLRTALYGLGAFIAIVFITPLSISLIASFGPQDWMHSYVGPALAYKNILIVISGVAAGLIGKQSPLLYASIVGLIGGIFILLLSGFSQSNSNYSLSMASLQIGAVSFLMCTFGGLCVTILNYVKTKL